MIAFTTMISVVVKSSVIAFTVLIATLLGTNIIYNISSVYRSLSTYFFLHLTDVDGILSGRIIAQTGALNFSYALSIFILLVSTMILLGISITVFKKRDILI
jgi:ABC-2 type transport system permease protein